MHINDLRGSCAFSQPYMDAEQAQAVAMKSPLSMYICLRVRDTSVEKLLASSMSCNSSPLGDLGEGMRIRVGVPIYHLWCASAMASWLVSKININCKTRLR